MRNSEHRQVLILAGADDVHAQAVEKHLSDMGACVEYWNTNLLESQSLLASRLSGKANEHQVKSLGEHRLALGNFDAIWLRRPGRIRGWAMKEPRETEFNTHETSRAIAGIFRSVKSFWLNHPARQEEAQVKLWQLHVAKSVGFAVPETLVTTNPDGVSSFFDRCGGEVVYKFHDSNSWGFIPYQEAIDFYTLPFRRCDLQHLDQVRSSLHLFQRNIRKSYELRVTGIGKKTFAARIESQVGRGKVDFRLDYSIPLSQYALPRSVVGCCQRLMTRLGLNFGAIDICVDLQGDYFFLEINPAGQFLWLEEALQQPLSLELARLLAGLEAPLVVA